MGCTASGASGSPVGEGSAHSAWAQGTAGSAENLHPYTAVTARDAGGEGAKDKVEDQVSPARLRD